MRLGTPNDIAAVGVFLCSAAVRTGELLGFNGGAYLRVVRSGPREAPKAQGARP